MNAQKILDQILHILSTVKEDAVKLQKILTFLEDEIYEEPDEPDEPAVPAKFEKAVKEIANGLTAGFTYYLNLDTGETDEIFPGMDYDPEDEEEEDEELPDKIELKYPDWEHRMEFEPLESQESFRIMSDFADSLKDDRLQHRLVNALNNRKPFANFKFIVENSEYRQDWFDFRQRYLERYVKELISLELQKEDSNEYSEEINGFYDDDGNKIDPESVPVPDLCVICKSRDVDDWDENLLCMMNRHDQQNEKEFKCGAFEKM